MLEELDSIILLPILFSAVAVAVSFMLYLVRFSSSKPGTGTSTHTRKMHKGGSANKWQQLPLVGVSGLCWQQEETSGLRRIRPAVDGIIL